MVGVDIIIGYFITGIIWGSTNAYMEIGSKEDEVADERKKGEDSNELKKGAKMFVKLGFLIPFLIN